MGWCCDRNHRHRNIVIENVTTPLYRDVDVKTPQTELPFAVFYMRNLIYIRRRKSTNLW